MCFWNDLPQFGYVSFGWNVWSCSVEKALESACLGHGHVNCLRGSVGFVDGFDSP